ncbi:MAG: methyltransferase domain-containing protein [Deltaproteobacteria bacterium]|nr:methyltransferase domain-containing protein [Deltaproteobacteria bacterium]
MTNTNPLSSIRARWDPHQYQRFSDERSRPFFDLVGRVPDDDVRTVADLGCGPGNLTSTLLDRWPEARVVGVDNSPEMLASATRLAPPPHLVFTLGDIATWRSVQPFDRIVSNAALQWVADHPHLIPHLVSQLAPRGVLAVQMPNNFSAPTHTCLEALLEQEPWVSILGPRQPQYFVQTPTWYADTLHDLGCTVDLWETIYYHVLTGPNAVLEWVKGTALRPTLSRLNAEQQREFQTVYGDKLRAAYPEGPHGTLFPFRRLFFVARRRA